MGEMTMPAESVAAQLATLLDRQSTIVTDVALIKQALADLPDHETRLRALERAQSRVAAIWAAAVVFGAAFGWLVSYATRPR